jgi:hypothetical protein
MIEDRMNKMHCLRVITKGDKDGNGASDKIVFTSAMGPLGSEVSIVDPAEVETKAETKGEPDTPPTAAEQKAPSKVKADVKTK